MQPFNHITLLKISHEAKMESSLYALLGAKKSNFHNKAGVNKCKQCCFLFSASAKPQDIPRVSNELGAHGVVRLSHPLSVKARHAGFRDQLQV